MGLDAFVRCNCYRDGLATLPPFPVELLRLNENGAPVGVESDFNDPLYEQFYEWRETACQHSLMELVSERVDNWWGYYSFCDALRDVGWEHFPILQEYLPSFNGGELPKEAAPKALAELNYFKAQSIPGTHWVLINTDSDEELYRSYGTFVWNGHPGGSDIGFDENGLYIINRAESGREVFRAKRIEQILLERELTEAGEDGRVQYTNLDNGVGFICITPISGRQIMWPDGQERNAAGRLCFEYPRYIQVEERPLTPTDFYSLERLIELMEGAIATGNPVEWC